MGDNASRNSMVPYISSSEQFEYIVIGTGAGGGPVAANLANAGKRVLVLEAGGTGKNPTSEFKYSVVGSNARLDPELGWAYWVNSRLNETERAQQHFYVPGKGLYYPRGTSIGGSTTVNAMIALYPDNDDWNAIAKLTGDASWDAGAMRDYYVRLENARYVDAAAAAPARHGRDGWLPLEQVGMKGNLFKDNWLTDYLVSRLRDQPGGDQVALAAATGGDFRVDPNDWRVVCERRVGLIDPPRSADNGARCGTRELLLNTIARHPEAIRIQTDCLVTRLLFADDDPTRVIGVEYLEGPHLYGASWYAEQFSSRAGVRRQAFASREVVLSAGAFNSPQLLMLSGIGPKEELERHGIQVRADRQGVGRNLQDRLESGVVCKLPFEPNLHKGCMFGAEGDPCKADFESGNPDASYRTRLNRQFYMLARSSSSREVPNLMIFGFTGRFRGYYHPTRVPPSGKDEFTWFVLSGHTENRGGRVTLRSDSPRDTPEINFNNFEDGTDTAGRDLDALLAGIKMARRMAGGVTGGSVPGEISPGPECRTDDDLRHFIRNEAWGHHASCTNQMGPASDPLAVVDSRFRVHGIKGLRVVDASVFPRIPGLFIAVPIFMIAEKASDVILADAAAA
ncbi:GMC family oxidoreductase [Microvirga lotononidis]|nr:GMC family oxidoreductase [Microvirga lotononidis]